jgi:hypothetical protein
MHNKDDCEAGHNDEGDLCTIKMTAKQDTVKKS